MGMSRSLRPFAAYCHRVERLHRGDLPPAPESLSTHCPLIGSALRARLSRAQSRLTTSVAMIRSRVRNSLLPLPEAGRTDAFYPNLPVTISRSNGRSTLKVAACRFR